jgi:hypothetical protein
MFENQYQSNLKANLSYRKLSDLKTTLGIIQAANLLAIEGYSHASASQILSKAAEQYNISCSPSVAGTICSDLHIYKTTVHGKNQYHLDTNQLDKLQKNLEQQIREICLKLESAIADFKELPSRINDLQSQWKNILKLQSQEKDLTNRISTPESNNNLTNPFRRQS